MEESAPKSANLSQALRMRAMQRFSTGKMSVLVCAGAMLDSEDENESLGIDDQEVDSTDLEEDEFAGGVLSDGEETAELPVELKSRKLDKAR